MCFGDLGPPYPAAWRLIRWAAEHIAELEGALIDRGHGFTGRAGPLDLMPVRGVCNFVYVYLRPKGDGVTQDDLDKWDAELYADPFEDEEEFRFPASIPAETPIPAEVEGG